MRFQRNLLVIIALSLTVAPNISRAALAPITAEEVWPVLQEVITLETSLAGVQTYLLSIPKQEIDLAPYSAHFQNLFIGDAAQTRWEPVVSAALQPKAPQVSNLLGAAQALGLAFVKAFAELGQSASIWAQPETLVVSLYSALDIGAYRPALAPPPPASESEVEWDALSVVQRLNHESVILLAETDKGTCDGSIVLRPTTNLFPYQEICGANVKIRELLANAGNITAELSSGGQEECEVFITAATDPDIEGVDDLVALVLAMPASSFCTEATRAAYIALLKKHIPLPTYRFRFGDPAPLPLTDVQSIATLSTEYLMKELLRARPGWLGPLSGDGGPGTTHPADTQEACSRALVPVKKISPISIAVGATVAVASLAGGIGAGYLLWGRKKTPALAS